MLRNKKGITLISLVVTIIVLIILATASVTVVFRDGGIIDKAKESKDMAANATEKENDRMSQTLAEYANVMYGDGSGESSSGDGSGSSGDGSGSSEGNDSTSVGPNNKQLVTTVATTDHTTIEAEDRLGNPIAIPGGFKVVEGELVQDGIVIQDSDGNEFVWIPVSNVDGDETADTNKLIKVEDDEGNITEEEITLGRYSFADSSVGTLVQTGSQWSNELSVYDQRSCKELCSSDNPDGLVDSYNRLNDQNAIYQTLEAFVASVEKYYGYYIARYEASYASGTTAAVGTEEENYKPASIVSKTASSSNEELTLGRLWTYIDQISASKICRNMYNENDTESSYVVSDLVNSYMWDTAIIYIQAMGNSGYAYATCETVGNTNGILNTGATGDEKCNIYDMAANVREWTTEYCTYTDTSEYLAYPCTTRGGYFQDSGYCSKTRYCERTKLSGYAIGFRASIYVK